MRIAMFFENLVWTRHISLSFTTTEELVLPIWENWSPEIVRQPVRSYIACERYGPRANLQSMLSLPCHSFTASQCWRSVWYVQKRSTNTHSLPLSPIGFSINKSGKDDNLLVQTWREMPRGGPWIVQKQTQGSRLSHLLSHSWWEGNRF